MQQGTWDLRRVTAPFDCHPLLSKEGKQRTPTSSHTQHTEQKFPELNSHQACWTCDHSIQHRCLCAIRAVISSSSCVVGPLLTGFDLVPSGFVWWRRPGPYSRRLSKAAVVCAFGGDGGTACTRHNVCLPRLFQMAWAPGHVLLPVASGEWSGEATQCAEPSPRRPPNICAGQIAIPGSQAICEGGGP